VTYSTNQNQFFGKDAWRYCNNCFELFGFIWG